MDQKEITIYGRVGINPELRHTKNDKPFCTFSLAEQASGMDNPTWHNVVMWEKDSEHWAKVLKKGTRVFVRGCMLDKKFRTQTGETRVYNEINADAIGLLN